MYCLPILLLVALLQVNPFRTAEATPPDQENQQPIVIELKRHGEFNYYAQIGVGTPPQLFDIVFRTSRSFFWLPYIDCGDPFCLEHRRYDDSKSSSSKFIRLSSLSDFSHNQFSLWTDIYRDDVEIGNRKLANIDFRGVYRFPMKNWFKEILDTMNFDGVIGLNSINECFEIDSQCLFIAQLHKKGYIGRQVFSIHLNKNATGDGGGPTGASAAGHIILGPSDERRFYRGEINYFNMDYDASLIFDDTPRKLNKSIAWPQFKCKIIIESSVNVLATCSEMLRKIASRLGAFRTIDDGLYKLGGCYLHLLPDMILELGGQNYTLTPEEYIIKDTVRNETACFLGIGETISTEEAIYLGAAFIRKYYTLFDVEKHRYGLAESVDADTPNLAPSSL